MSKGTGGQGGSRKKSKKKSGKGGGKPAAPKGGTGSTFGTGTSPITDRSRGMHSQTPYGQANAAGIPRRTSG